MASLRDVADQCIVVCYKEDVSDLTEALRATGITPVIQRGTYTPEELKRPAAVRCLMNHRDAWRAASERTGYTIICEGDFVPCRDMGSLPVFWPLDNPRAWGYLYQGSPRVLSLVGPQRFIRTHCCPTVAYVINAQVARMLLEFYDEVTARYGLDTYYSFEAHLQWDVMGKGGEAYMPERHYGEHGGAPNPEHAQFSKVIRGGIGRADNLARPLAFVPQYAVGGTTSYWKERLIGRALGIGRFLTGRWIVDTNVYPRDRAATLAMMALGIRRLV